MDVGNAASDLGETTLVKGVVFPRAVTANGKIALRGFDVVQSVVVPRSCIIFCLSAF
jgi:hypothetical protein